MNSLVTSIFVSPLFDLEKLTKFADDNFVIRWSKNLDELKNRMEASMQTIISRMKDSGLKVNEKKTELCLFHRNSQEVISIVVGGQIVNSTHQMNVLGVLFDSNLTWAKHVNKALMKANSMKFAIRMIAKFFSKKELR